MKQISTFEEFKAAVIKEIKGNSHWVVAPSAVLSGIVSSLFEGPTIAKITAYQVWKNTNPGTFKGYHCCNCGKDFSA